MEQVGFFLTLRAYIMTQTMPMAVNTAYWMKRNHSWGLPWMPATPWAISTLKGLTVEPM